MYLKRLIAKQWCWPNPPRRGLFENLNVLKGRQANAPGGAKLKASSCMFSILLSLAIPSGYSIAAEQGDLRAMSRYADSNLSEILSNIPVGEEGNYGFQNQDELKEASLGIPYQEYDLEKEEPTGYWRIPVTINGENRALLRLKSTPDGWTFSGLGGAELAQDLADQEDKMTRQGKNPRSGRIVRDFYLLSDYVQFDQQADGALSGTVYPLSSATQFMSMLGTAYRVSNDDNGGYELGAIKKMRSKALENKGNPDTFDNSNGGGRQ